MKWRLAGACAMAILVAGCLRINVQGDPARALDRHALGQLETIMRQATPLRVATYNTSLYSDEAGGLVRRLGNGDDKARRIAAVLQRVRPDLVLLNEFDYDPAHRAADLFQRARRVALHVDAQASGNEDGHRAGTQQPPFHLCSPGGGASNCRRCQRWPSNPSSGRKRRL